jgi:energy-converting hydrogenase Eha subunit E
MSASTVPRFVPLVQGTFYLATGAWPIVNLGSFEAVTGSKREGWLVKTLGGLIIAVGASLLMGAFEKTPSRALRVLGFGSAAALGLSDLVYVLRGRISPVYVGDAIAEAVFAAGSLAAA